jgi:MtN3 and saliva related transmembrane protein
MNYQTFIGLIAATLTTIASMPQAIKTIRTKSTKDLSLGMYVMLITGVVVWLIYGLLVKDTPIILSNFVTLVPLGAILIMKIKYK